MLINNQSNADYSYTLPDGSVVSGNQPSNVVVTEVITDLFTKVKTGDKTFLRPGETTVHTVTFTNNSSTTILSPFFSDVMTAGAAYVPGSVTVGGVSQPTFDPLAGFALADIPAGSSLAVSYTLRADDPLTQTQVDNHGRIQYSINDPVHGERSFDEVTNTLTVVLVEGKIGIVKSADRAYAVVGDTIRYTTVVSNTSIELTGLVFRDPIPAGTAFVAGSVTIDGVSYPALDPAVGFVLSDLAPGASATVVFDVTVV